MMILSTRAALKRLNLVQSGFTLVEALVTVAILGIVSAIAIPSFAFVLRRERVNAVALEAAGWLEEARSQSAKEVNQDLLRFDEIDSDAGGCVIILAGSNPTGVSGGAVVATVESITPGRCDVRQTKLLVPDSQGVKFKIGVFGLGAGKPAGDPLNPCKTEMGMFCAGSVSLWFTPRGMWSSTSIDSGQELEIRIAHADGNGPKRCVRISSILGSVDIGRAADGDISSSCNTWGAI